MYGVLPGTSLGLATVTHRGYYSGYVYPFQLQPRWKCFWGHAKSFRCFLRVVIGTSMSFSPSKIIFISVLILFKGKIDNAVVVFVERWESFSCFPKMETSRHITTTTTTRSVSVYKSLLRVLFSIAWALILLSVTLDSSANAKFRGIPRISFLHCSWPRQFDCCR